ncbi:MAG: hypothetical protein NC299_15075 [Lachnospiraceae bacterium]|nr:hypothetical protein [Lachnospiraceae bacterium]
MAELADAPDLGSDTTMEFSLAAQLKIKQDAYIVKYIKLTGELLICEIKHGCGCFDISGSEDKVAKYIFKYMFEWGGVCLWSVNDAAMNKFGYAIDEQKLPISGNLKRLLWYLQAYHDNMLDWDNAPEGNPWWTEEDTVMFSKKRKFAYEQLQRELGDEYEIIDPDREWYDNGSDLS